MPLNLDDKKALVTEVSAVAAQAQSLVAAEYRGLTVTEMTELRAQARGQGICGQEHAGAPGRGRDRIREHRRCAQGPLALAFSNDYLRRGRALVKAFLEGPRETGSEKCRRCSCCRLGFGLRRESADGER
jgi:large subunit ribosomal protein L10